MIASSKMRASSKMYGYEAVGLFDIHQALAGSFCHVVLHLYFDLVNFSQMFVGYVLFLSDFNFRLSRLLLCFGCLLCCLNCLTTCNSHRATIVEHGCTFETFDPLIKYVKRRSTFLRSYNVLIYNEARCLVLVLH